MLGMDAVEGLETWLTPFLATLGRKTRRTWAPLCVRGLLGPGDAKYRLPSASPGPTTSLSVPSVAKSSIGCMRRACRPHIITRR